MKFINYAIEVLIGFLFAIFFMFVIYMIFMPDFDKNNFIIGWAGCVIFYEARSLWKKNIDN